MKKILCIISAAVVSFATQLAVAAEVTPIQPSACPSVAVIKPRGVSTNTMQFNKLWFAGRRHEAYGNPDFLWTFIVGDIPASTNVEAFQKAMFGLKTISLQTGPFYDMQLNRWMCLYATQTGLPAVAINPPLDQSSQMLATVSDMFDKYKTKN